MNLTLKRTRLDKSGVFGHLLDENGIEIAVTLEHSYNGKPKLPDGVYKCVHGWHALKNGDPFYTFEITGVPGHTGILFHTGNWNKDSEGCVLLGTTIWRDQITHSCAAFGKFMSLQGECKEFTLNVGTVTAA